VSANLTVEGVSFALGLLFGSFANVCVVRLPADESVITPRSRCNDCGAPIRAFDNIPILSWLLLRGRCRACHASIPWRYPLVELAVGAWFAISALPLAAAHGLDLDPILRLLVLCTATATLGWLLITLAVTDWLEHLLPNELTYGGIFAAFLFTCAQALLLNPDESDVILKRRININSANAGHSPGNIFLTGPEHLIFGRMLAAIAAFLLLWGIGALYKMVRRRPGMGLGDAKLLALIAAFLGFQPTLLAFFLATLFASAYGVILLARGKANALTHLPFGSFLAVAGLFAALAAEPAIDAYLRLFGAS
jgi:leader peptidase (prepilin peptidase)/N-methyltransferase